MSSHSFASGARFEVKIWNIETEECLKEFNEEFGSLWDFELSNDGRLICLYSYELMNGSLLKIIDILNNF